MLTSELIPEDDGADERSIDRIGFGWALLCALIVGAAIGAIV